MVLEDARTGVLETMKSGGGLGGGVEGDGGDAGIWALSARKHWAGYRSISEIGRRSLSGVRDKPGHGTYHWIRCGIKICGYRKRIRHTIKFSSVEASRSG